MKELKNYLKQLVDEGVIHIDVKDQIVYLAKKINNNYYEKSNSTCRN